MRKEERQDMCRNILDALRSARHFGRDDLLNHCLRFQNKRLRARDSDRHSRLLVFVVVVRKRSSIARGGMRTTVSLTVQSVSARDIDPDTGLFADFLEDSTFRADDHRNGRSWRIQNDGCLSPCISAGSRDAT